jgi:formylglycine-generating enzyme required for sulfatase activity
MKRALYTLALVLLLVAACKTPQPTQVSSAPAPTIEIVSPPSGVRVVQGEELEIETKSVDGRGVDRIELWVDDAIYRVDEAGAQPSYHVIQRWRADTPGQHKLRVQAINVDERTSQPVTIVVEVLDPSLFTTTPTLTPTSTGTPTLTPTPTLTATRLPPTAAATPETVVPTTTITTTATPTPTAEITPQAPTAPSQMVYVPAGKFLMGSNDDHVLQATEWCGCGKDQFVDELYMHEVYVSAFYIDKYEVTNRQFLAFADAAGYVTDAEKKYEANTWRTAFTPGKEDHPVVWMTWNDASAYCQWAGKRLPTEAEWEKAARGDDARLWPWGNEWDNTRLNMKQGMRGTTTKVGSFPGGASPYGAMDMGGNTWEWVNDWHSFTYYQNGVDRDQDPKGPEGGEDRVLRGGAFNNGMHDVRCANRHRGGQMGYAPDHGFRCAKSAN